MARQRNDSPQPFLKWAGGKGQLLDQYEPYFPASSGAYFEPFVGSGAVFFHLCPRGLFEHYTLSEVNAELITCYEAVRDSVEALIARLADHQARHDQAYYYHVRAWDRDPGWANTPVIERAARMIYLNKTCYNGLWRVNSQGQFNVPVGRYENPDVVGADRLRAASRALQGVTIQVLDFERVAYAAQRGDFVYLDPPYFPRSDTSNFTSYSTSTFGVYEHEKLALTFRELHRRGCRVMLSNSDTPFVRALYEGFRIETVQGRRAINSKTDKRGPVSEVVVLNY